MILRRRFESDANRIWKLEKKVVVCVSALAKYTSHDSVTWSMVEKYVRPIASSDMIYIIFAKDFCKRQRKFKYTTERQSFCCGSVKRGSNHVKFLRLLL